jgi:hypothetical protein
MTVGIIFALLELSCNNQYVQHQLQSDRLILMKLPVLKNCRDVTFNVSTIQNRADWGEAIDVSIFYDRSSVLVYKYFCNSNPNFCFVTVGTFSKLVKIAYFKAE